MAFSPGPGGGGSGSIAGSSDVSLDSLQNDEVLSYDSASSKWQNKSDLPYEPIVAGAKQSVIFQSTSASDVRPTASTAVSVTWLTDYPQQPDNFAAGDLQFEVGEEV